TTSGRVIAPTLSESRARGSRLIPSISRLGILRSSDKKRIVRSPRPHSRKQNSFRFRCTPPRTSFAFDDPTRSNSKAGPDSDQTRTGVGPDPGQARTRPLTYNVFMRLTRLLGATTIAIAIATFAALPTAQRPTTAPPADALSFRFLGPVVGNRVASVAGVP